MNLSLPKKVLVGCCIAAVAVMAVAFVYRYSILQYTADTLIRNALPDYIRIDRISFGFVEGRVIIGGFKVVNPQGFSAPYLIEIGEISCRYSLRGKSILDGIDIKEPVFRNAVLSIERLPNGATNLDALSAMIARKQGGGAPGTAQGGGRPHGAAGQGIALGKDVAANRKLSDIIQLPESYAVKNGKLVLIDGLVSRKPWVIVFDNIAADLTLRLNPAYTRVITAASTGSGNLFGQKDQIIRWNVVYNPATPRLTMANRFEVEGVDITIFVPYYDRYSPLIFRSGRVSGTLVFDFDNGNIGSTNEVRLSNLSFQIKPGSENAEFWGTTVPELAKYFSTSSGDIVFDFKIKGSMEHPDFYLGPISKRALTFAVVDKITQAISGAVNTQGQGLNESGEVMGSQSQNGGSEAIADTIKLLMKKVK